MSKKTYLDNPKEPQDGVLVGPATSRFMGIQSITIVIFFWVLQIRENRSLDWIGALIFISVLFGTIGFFALNSARKRFAWRRRNIPHYTSVEIYDMSVFDPRHRFAAGITLIVFGFILFCVPLIHLENGGAYVLVGLFIFEYGAWNIWLNRRYSLQQ